jgi:hypothetical protein
MDKAQPEACIFWVGGSTGCCHSVVQKEPDAHPCNAKTAGDGTCSFHTIKRKVVKKWRKRNWPSDD